MAESVQVATLKWALRFAGSTFELARRVGLSASTVQAFLDGSEKMPGWVFLRVVDYVNDAQLQAHQPATVVALRDRPKPPAS